MRYFSTKEILIGVALTSWGCLIVWFIFISDKNFGDVAVNLITDIWFAIFVVFVIDYANKKDRDSRNRARQRAVALAVQKFYQAITRIIQAMIADGVASSPLSSLPTRDIVVQRAMKFHATTALYADIREQPAPYAAYFLCDFVGSAAANVHPERTTSEWLRQLASEISLIYRDVFSLDDGFLSDEVVDALTVLKDFHLVILARDVLWMRPIRIGFWPEEDLNTVAIRLDVLRKYFNRSLIHSSESFDGFLADSVMNALAKKSQ